MYAIHLLSLKILSCTDLFHLASLGLTDEDDVDGLGGGIELGDAAGHGLR